MMIKPKYQALVTALLLAMLAGSARADLFAFLKPKPKPAGPLIDPLDAKKLGYTAAWASDLAIPSGLKILWVERLDDLVVVIDSDHMVSAVNVSDGSVRWQTSLDMPTARVFAPTRFGDKVVVNTETNVLLLSAERGQIVERQELDWAVSNAPVLIDHMAIFGAINGRLFGHDLRSGFHKWAYQMGSQVAARPTPAGLDVFAASIGGVYGLFTSRGEKVWLGRTHDRIDASAVVDRLLVIFPSHDHTLYAVSRTTGRDQWLYRTTEPLRSAPVLLERVVLLPLSKPQVVALEVMTGRELWRKDGRFDPVWGRDGRLLVSFGNALMTLDARSGAPFQNVPTLDLRAVLPGADGSLILVSPTGRLARINPGA